jgi:hypothetical protein
MNAKYPDAALMDFANLSILKEFTKKEITHIKCS